MSNWFSSVQSKLSSMRTFCLDQSAANCDPLNVADSQAAYNAQFDELEAAIETYKSGSVESRSEHMRNIIMFTFTDYMLADVDYSPPIEQHSAPFPTGYNDFWELFSMNGLATTILGYDNSYYYESCIITPTGTTSRLQADITSIGGAEVADAALRVALVSYLQSYPVLNALILLVENSTFTIAPKNKETTGAEIYTTRNAEEIINDFGLTTYIASYI